MVNVSRHQRLNGQALALPGAWPSEGAGLCATLKSRHWQPQRFGCFFVFVFFYPHHLSIKAQLCLCFNRDSGCQRGLLWDFSYFMGERSELDNKAPPPPSSSAQKWRVSLLPTLNWLNESHDLVSCQWGQEVSSSSKKGHDI